MALRVVSQLATARLDILKRRPRGHKFHRRANPHERRILVYWLLRSLKEEKTLVRQHRSLKYEFDQAHGLRSKDYFSRRWQIRVKVEQLDHFIGFILIGGSHLTSYSMTVFYAVYPSLGWWIFRQLLNVAIEFVDSIDVFGRSQNEVSVFNKEPE